MLLQLLTAPVSLPVFGLRFILQQLLEVAEQELMDVDRIHEELLLLQLRLEEGEITEKEYLDAEAAIMLRLREARAYRAARGAG
ncbi:MAG TPA: gas vesicle protein GvpG [Dehalococcoidia bacterium]|nr:gas vesicle protein GvpG [Dehalococcoidia bacterium]